MIWSALLFAVSTFMCGASNSLEELIFWRIVQGAAGAPLVPLGQTILLDSSPRPQHATVMSIFGMANMIGPSLGPMFAGQIAETLGWRWGFWMIVPVAVAAVIGSLDRAAEDRAQGGRAGSIGWASSACRPALPPASSSSRAGSGSTGSTAPRSSSRRSSAAS